MSAPIMISSWPRAILHLDGDAFFASCEQAVHPEWRGRPVVTGKERGIVAAASYEAKARGVTRGVSLRDVPKLCPDAIIVPSDYETYSLFSKRMFAIMRRFTSVVEEYSIDEGFADITGLRRSLRDSYEGITRRMQSAIHAELGLTVSVGLSLSKTLAKVGSKWQKPAGFTAISGRHIHEYLEKLPVEKIWGIGPQTSAYCRQLNIRTALDFARRDEEFIMAKFTKPLQETWRELNGEAVFEIATEDKSDYATVSKTKTFTPPSTDPAFVRAQLLKNLENATIKARRHHLVATGLAIWLVGQDYRSVGAEATLNRPSAYPLEMGAVVENMFVQLFRQRTPYRATGVVLTGLQSAGATQLDLFEPPLRLEKLSKLYRAVDEIAAAYGKHCVYTAGAAAAHHPSPLCSSPSEAQRSRGAGPPLGSGQNYLCSERSEIPWRKLHRLPGETKRRHLSVPLLGSAV
ncbi:MAG: DNA polymerase IV [Patescibacteria group bacterium]|nr:DNA polymerase IV [Patescibacteria group bacterium]